MISPYVTALTNSLTAMGLTAVSDPRAARPYTVFVELPIFDTYAHRVSDVTVTIRCLAAPAGNTNSATWLLATVDTILEANIGVISGRPSVAVIGEQNLPAYDLVVRMAIQSQPPPPPTP